MICHYCVTFGFHINVWLHLCCRSSISDCPWVLVVYFFIRYHAFIESIFFIFVRCHIFIHRYFYLQSLLRSLRYMHLLHLHFCFWYYLFSLFPGFCSLPSLTFLHVLSVDLSTSAIVFESTNVGLFIVCTVSFDEFALVPSPFLPLLPFLSRFRDCHRCIWFYYFLLHNYHSHRRCRYVFGFNPSKQWSQSSPLSPPYLSSLLIMLARWSSSSWLIW